jgi:hypothetical protein
MRVRFVIVHESGVMGLTSYLTSMEIFLKQKKDIVTYHIMASPFNGGNLTKSI